MSRQTTKSTSAWRISQVLAAVALSLVLGATALADQNAGASARVLLGEMPLSAAVCASAIALALAATGLRRYADQVGRIELFASSAAAGLAIYVWLSWVLGFATPVVAGILTAAVVFVCAGVGFRIFEQAQTRDLTTIPMNAEEHA